MSDARAKAEARRAKILARDSSKRTVSAFVAEDEDDSLYANLGEIKGKDRPIAARRNLIKTTSQLDDDAIVAASEPTTPMEKSERKAEGEEESSSPVKESNKENNDKTADTTETPVKSSSEPNTSTTPSIEKPETTTPAADKSKPATESSSAKQSVISPKSTFSKLPPPKTMEEIEREVAENTAKFDRNMSFRSNNKVTPERAAQLEKLAQRKGSAPIDPSNLMRLVRLLVIGLLAAYTGYRTAEVSRMEALQPSRLTELQTIKQFDDFGNVVSEVPMASLGDVTKKNPAEGRTWIGYFQDQYVRRSECTISAVMLSWWIAGMCKRFVTSSQKQQKSKVNIIEQVYNYINGFQEAALSTLGEFAWHLFVLVFTVLCHTLYFSNVAIAAAGNGDNTCVAGSDGTCIAPVGASTGEL